MPYFAISGRIPGDNQDFSFVFAAQSRAEAEELFRQRICDLNLSCYGDQVQISHVFESQRPITEA